MARLWRAYHSIYIYIYIYVVVVISSSVVAVRPFVLRYKTRRVAVMMLRAVNYVTVVPVYKQKHETRLGCLALNENRC